ncbi:MAG: hypothetical protein GY853_14580 [PVC group bacterium]|nr:hypothetical protein [PVC group bacterium]
MASTAPVRPNSINQRIISVPIPPPQKPVKQCLYVGQGLPCDSDTDILNNAKIGDIYRDLDTNIIYGYGLKGLTSSTISSGDILTTLVTNITLSSGVATVTTGTHNLPMEGSTITLDGVTGITGIDGVHEATYLTATTFSIETTATGTYVSGGVVYNMDVGFSSGAVITGTIDNLINSTGVSVNLNATDSFFGLPLDFDVGSYATAFTSLTIGPAYSGTQDDLKYVVIECSSNGYDWKIIKSLDEIKSGALGTITLTDVLPELQGKNYIRIRNTKGSAIAVSTAFSLLKADETVSCLWEPLNYYYAERFDLDTVDDNTSPWPVTASKRQQPTGGLLMPGLYEVSIYIRFSEYEDDGGGHGAKVSAVNPIKVEFCQSGGTWKEIHLSNNLTVTVGSVKLWVNSLQGTDFIEIDASTQATRLIEYRCSSTNGIHHTIDADSFINISYKRPL